MEGNSADRHWQTKVLDTWKVPQLNVRRQKSVNVCLLSCYLGDLLLYGDWRPAVHGDRPVQRPAVPVGDVSPAVQGRRAGLVVRRFRGRQLQLHCDGGHRGGESHRLAPAPAVEPFGEE